MHPGQFTVLNSVSPAVVRASVLELVWHARFLDALGTDAASKIVIHVGGMADGPEAAMERFVRVAGTLPQAVRRRLIVENDERLFTAEQVLSVSRATLLPVAFDWLHHRANPGSARTAATAARAVAACFDTWRADDGIPKIHLSSQARGARRGRHGDWVRPSDLLSFLAVAPPRPFDCMIEAKKKDLALFRLRRQLALAGVVEGGRRPGGSPRSGPAWPVPLIDFKRGDAAVGRQGRRRSGDGGRGWSSAGAPRGVRQD